MLGTVDIFCKERKKESSRDFRVCKRVKVCRGGPYDVLCPPTLLKQKTKDSHRFGKDRFFYPPFYLLYGPLERRIESSRQLSLSLLYM